MRPPGGRTRVSADRDGFLVGVGALCPFVSENAAVATQSFVQVSHGANAVDMADRGVSVPTACEALLADDAHA